MLVSGCHEDNEAKGRQDQPIGSKYTKGKDYKGRTVRTKSAAIIITALAT